MGRPSWCREEVKERIRNHSLLSMLVRPQVPFTVTALHGLCTLYGPPGTGKTTLARGLPAQLAPFVPGRQVRRIEINPHGLMTAEHGQSQQRVSELLAEYVPALAGDGKPTVVILDEVESMAVARSEASLAANPADVHRATDAVLTALDDNARHHPNLFFVATSNFTAALDGAFLSRSDAAILVPLPGPRGGAADPRDHAAVAGGVLPRPARARPVAGRGGSRRRRRPGWTGAGCASSSSRR